PRTPGLSLSVNLSGRQILQPDLVEQISDVLDATGLDPRLLRLELTEGVLVENEAAAARCLNRLRQLGLKLVIDDFGTGYSAPSFRQAKSRVRCRVRFRSRRRVRQRVRIFALPNPLAYPSANPQRNPAPDPVFMLAVDGNSITPPCGALSTCTGPSPRTAPT